MCVMFLIYLYSIFIIICDVMCNVLNMFDMPRYLHATLYIYVQYFHIYVCDVQIYMFDVRGIFLFYVFRLYAMSSGKRSYG